MRGYPLLYYCLRNNVTVICMQNHLPQLSGRVNVSPRQVFFVCTPNYLRNLINRRFRLRYFGPSSLSLSRATRAYLPLLCIFVRLSRQLKSGTRLEITWQAQFQRGFCYGPRKYVTIGTRNFSILQREYIRCILYTCNLFARFEHFQENYFFFGSNSVFQQILLNKVRSASFYFYQIKFILFAL